MTIKDSRTRSLLNRAMQLNQTTRVRDILSENGQLTCRVCSEANVSVHPQKGWGVTVMCEKEACQAVHTVLI